MLTNVELDHHATFALAGRAARGRSASSSRAAPKAVVWDRPELLALCASPVRLRPVAASYGRDCAERPAAKWWPLRRLRRRSRADRSKAAQRFRWREHEVRLAVPGAHNALNAAAALEAARLAGADLERAIAGLAELPRRRAALPAPGRGPARGGAVRGLRPPPDRGRGDAAAPRARSPTSGSWRSSSRTCTRARRCWPREFGAALALADVVVGARRLPGARARRGSSRA